MSAKVFIAPLAEEHLPQVRRFLLEAAALPFDWDTNLRDQDRAAMVTERLAHAGDRCWSWVALRDEQVVGVARLSHSAWDTAHFGVTMAALDVLHASDEAAAEALLQEIHRRVQQEGFRHLRHTLDAREPMLLRVLQKFGWTCLMGMIALVGDVERLSTGTFPVKEGEFEVVPTEPAHLEPLLEIVPRLPQYSSLEIDPALPEEARRRYTATRIRNCVERSYATHCITLLHQGRICGLEAGRVMSYPPEVATHSKYSVEVDVFVDPSAPRTAGRTIARAMTAQRKQEGVRFILCRSRLQGAPVQRMLLSLGFYTHGGDFFLSWAK